MKDLETLKKEFIDAAIGYDKAIDDGNSNEATKWGKKMNKLCEILYSNKSYGLDKILDLMDYPDDNVRFNAAATVIIIEPEKAKKVLSEIAQKRGLVAFRAETFLSLWEKGDIEFAWAKDSEK